LGANGAYGYPPIPAGATPLPHGAPVAAWTTTQRIDHSDFLSTGKLEPPTLRRSVVMPELEPRRTANPGVIISLGLCGALVLGIVVWIAVNVAGQKGTANAQETSASAAQTTSPPPPPPPPAVAPTTAPVASVASATPSATTAPTAPRPVTAPKQPRPGKGKSPPSFLRPK
jgi:cytoskeletal protein RodZ